MPTHFKLKKVMAKGQQGNPDFTAEAVYNFNKFIREQGTEFISLITAIREPIENKNFQEISDVFPTL